jgi:transcriptional regulator of acetoin/glycerol metabolism
MTPLDAVLDPPTAPALPARPQSDHLLRVLVVDDSREPDTLRDLLTSQGLTVVALTGMCLHDVEGLLVRQAMMKHAGNVSRAARTLGLSRSALYRRLERHHIAESR